MRIINTAQDFFDVYHQRKSNGQELLLSDLELYYARHTESFANYFPQHCPNTEERLFGAIKKYPNQLTEMEKVVEQLPTIIGEVCQRLEQFCQYKPELSYHLIVGGFGSNAFVERKVEGDVYFAVEKLSPHPEHLAVIVAHELGHIYHNVVSHKAGLNWSKVDWEHGALPLYREGVATYISQQLVPELDSEVYFTYDSNGAPWYSFAVEHKSQIARAFSEDCSKKWAMEQEREWFRLSGGQRFGHNRLGYYLGAEFTHYLVQRYGESHALCLWVERDIKQEVLEWLKGEVT